MDEYELLRPIPEPPGPPARESHVVYIEQWCRACGEAFSSGESFAAINTDADNINVVGPYKFPRDGDLDCSRKSAFNWDPFDVRDDQKHEIATTHTDCFNLFRQSCTDHLGVHRLVLAGVWRSPWADAPKFELAVVPDVAGLIRLAATACDLPQLESMPTELKRLVWEELITQPSTITRYQSVISLAADSSRQHFYQEASMSIGKAASWQRGESPASEENDLPPVVRITIDSQGVKRIERLVRKPELLSQQSDTELYIVESQKTLADVEVQFQSGLARLKIHGDKKATYLIPWDTPTPPVVEHLLSPTARPSSTRVAQFSTIDVSKITGITFFMAWITQNPLSTTIGPEFIIHAHTPKTPSARPTFDRLSAKDWSGVWYYVPFPSNDRLTFFGVRHVDAIYLQILFRFEKAGDFVVGFMSRQYPDTDDTVWPAGDKMQLICGLSESGSTVTLDAHPKRSGTINPPFTLPIIQNLPAFDREAFVSWAPLENVVCLRTFTDEDASICRGLLLEYENGAQRSLGECRIGLDVERAYVKPVCLCLGRKSGQRRWRIKVRVDGQQGHTHTEDDWECHEMHGTLVSWYMRGYSELKVVDDDDNEDDDESA